MHLFLQSEDKDKIGYVSKKISGSERLDSPDIKVKIANYMNREVQNNSQKSLLAK